jgi:hypothetical protein
MFVRINRIKDDTVEIKVEFILLVSNIEYHYLSCIRERPFNLKGGLWFFSKKNILIPNVAEKNILILVEEQKII